MVENLDITLEDRVIIMSDIHGDLDLFKKALDHVHFTDKDILIINGDIAEKGVQIIALFKYILELKKNHRVYGVMGNCDYLINHFNNPEVDEGMIRYMNRRRLTLLAELKKEMGGDPTYQERVAYMKTHYQDIMDWVESLPLVLKTPYFICSHAAYSKTQLNRHYNTATPDFFSTDVSFEVPVLVGHYPVCIYDHDEINHNIRFDKSKNIISMDGGNRMKALGQLNLVIFENGDFTFDAVDHLNYHPAPYNQVGKKGTHIHWPDFDIKVIAKDKEYSDIIYLKDNHQLRIANHFMNPEDDTLLGDVTDALLDVKKGDPIYIEFELDDAYYIKSKGYEGWYLKK